LVEATGGIAGGGQVDRLNETIPTTALRANADGRLEWVDFEAARTLFYHDCDEATAQWAFARLSPAPPEILLDPVSVPRFWSAALPRTYIICRQDRALPHATALNFAGRLGIAPYLIDGSHSPFLSRPAELAQLLVSSTGAHATP
jgi:pimeloyl-ACP methyl ester carboxylesterase